MASSCVYEIDGCRKAVVALAWCSAHLFDVSPGAISSISRGKNWSWLA